MSIRLLENELLDIIQGSAIKNRVREIELLPDVKEKSLVSRFETKAPAIYISYNRAPKIDDYANRQFSIVCLARNSRSHEHQRPGKGGQHGDGRTIGLFEMVDYLEALLNYNQGWRVESDMELQIDVLKRAGLYGASIQLSIRDSINPPDDESLVPFITWTAEHSMIDGIDEPVAKDHVTLEQ